ERPHQPGRVDTENERPRAGGVRERAEHVEHRTRRELAPNRRRMLHRRVVRLREEEAEAELVDRALDPLRRELEPEAERLARVRPREVVAVEQPRDNVLDHNFPSRKLRARAGPSGVSTDSGWNWTPTAGSSRCRTAITSPSSANAVGSSASGSRVAASE